MLNDEVRAAIERIFQKQRDLPLCIGRRFLLDLADEPAVCEIMANSTGQRFILGSDMSAALRALATACQEGGK